MIIVRLDSIAVDAIIASGSLILYFLSNSIQVFIISLFISIIDANDMKSLFDCVTFLYPKNSI